MTAVLAEADPEKKKASYQEFGLSLRYANGRVLVEARPRVVESSVGGAITPWRTRVKLG